MILTAGCGDGSSSSGPANDAVRGRIAALAPAKLAHRGMGPTRPLGAFPENSLSAFRAGIEAGADGIELDVELTADGQLLVMHDDRLDRTTMCAGCVNTYTLAEARACVLLRRTRAADGPTPAHASPRCTRRCRRTVLVNVELKVFGDDCATPSTDAATLARVAVAEVKRLGAPTAPSSRRSRTWRWRRSRRRIRSSTRPCSSAGCRPALIEQVAALGLDAVHPFFTA